MSHSQPVITITIQKPGKKSPSPALRRFVIDHAANGAPIDELAAMAGVTAQTVLGWCKNSASIFARERDAAFRREATALRQEAKAQVLAKRKREREFRREEKAQAFEVYKLAKALRRREKAKSIEAAKLAKALLRKEKAKSIEAAKLAKALAAKEEAKATAKAQELALQRTEQAQQRRQVALEKRQFKEQQFKEQQANQHQQRVQPQHPPVQSKPQKMEQQKKEHKASLMLQSNAPTLVKEALALVPVSRNIDAIAVKLDVPRYALVAAFLHTGVPIPGKKPSPVLLRRTFDYMKVNCIKMPDLYCK